MAILGHAFIFSGEGEIGRTENRGVLPLFLMAVFVLFPFLALASFKPVEIKAAYLYNLINFVHWPESSGQNGPFVIQVLGNPLLARNLALLTRGEKVVGRNIVIEFIDSVDEIKMCQMLFVDSSQEDNVSPDLMEKLAKKHILTVGDSMDLLRKGAMVGLLRKGRRIILVVNAQLAASVGISFSAKLLKVARIY